MMTDENLKNLEHKVQIELEKVNSWLCQNKLSLIFSKTNYVMIKKHYLNCQILNSAVDKTIVKHAKRFS